VFHAFGERGDDPPIQIIEQVDPGEDGERRAARDDGPG